ncbi:hypothetical protein [Christiangramia crocea]|uniref:Adhesin domain-containing protein n=1 Tax=Christiangramia crocea TaxID=2904124 RepID=A0A9X1UWB2_9FLAO|nr:hypothetical protein [Gramella crocea]MCG9971305.1 hypothetical protein [Gramella crocea]
MMLVSCLALAQRDTEEKIDAGNIKTIRIDADEVYRIRLTTTEVSTITLRTHSEGEYYDDIILDTSLKGDEFRLSSRYPEILSGGYDKLSAHKVFSLEIELEVPKGMEVIIKSNLASVIVKGDYESVYADLKQGYCHLLSYSGSAVINTYSGDIYVETTSGLIEARSRNGEVNIPEFLPGRKPLRLTSIDGDIRVLKN